MQRHGMTVAELLRQPPTLDVETGGKAFGLGRTTAYALARTGQFPCRVIRAGKSYRVITADLLRVLGIVPDNGNGPGVAAPSPLAETHSSTSADQ